MLQPLHFFAAGHLPHAVPCLFTTLIAREGRVSKAAHQRPRGMFATVP
jgi:hypothetical protein